jgi:hypothetical protein
MRNAVLAAAVLAGGLVAAPSAFAYTAQALCPQWVQRGPYIDAICFNGHNNDMQPAHIDIRTCAPGADINNYFGRLVCINPQRPSYRGYPPPPPPYGGGWRDDGYYRHGPRGPWD